MEMHSELSHHQDHDHHETNADASAAAEAVQSSPTMIVAAHMDAAASISVAVANGDDEEIDEEVHGAESPSHSHSPSSSSAHDPTSVAANAIDMKKTGRPVHPLWAHFHRGEKRNRYHYHAFCIYCVARYGPEHVPPTRGVSIDMLRHVEKCTNCPRKVVESVKDICGRRDAVRFDRYLKKKSDTGDDPLAHHHHQQHHEDDEHNATGDGGGVAENARLMQQQQQQQQQHDGAAGVSVEQTHAERIRQQHAEYQRNVQLRHQQQQQQEQQRQQQLLHEREQQQQQQQQQELEKRPSEVDSGEVAGENPNASSHIDLTGSGNSSGASTGLHRSIGSMSAANAGTHEPSGAPAAAAPTAAALNHAPPAAGSANTAPLLGKHTLRTTGFETQNSTHQQHATSGSAHHGNNSNSSGALSVKRARTSSPADKWKTHLLKTAVTAGLPFQAFQNAEFQELMRYIHPSAATATTPVSSSGSSGSTLNHLSGITDQKFLSETAGRLALVQLDRVKEGMHNSTIKGGLTLSVNCWSTLDLQQLVAFTLVNSNGDAACVCVIDMGTQANAYSSTQLAVKIEDVLQKLEELHICVMGIVADSIISLNAARCVCFAEKRKSLLVVPCFARQLSVLAGSLLTHELFRDAVGQTIEIASYFSNASLQNVLKLVSGDDAARIPMPNRANWYSFLDCISAMLKYCDVVTAICTEADSSGAGGGDGSNGGEVASVAPQRLKELVFAGEGKLWKTLQELNTLLLPLKETYVLVFQHKLKGSHPGTTDGVGDSTRSAITTNENDFFVAAHGLTLAHIMYQLARMNQQYAGLVGTHHEPLAQMMQARINVTWQHYDLPVMVLAYVFNFHLDNGLLNMESREAFQWETIAAYFQEYFSTWFHDKSAGGGLSRPSHPGSLAPGTASTNTNSPAASSGANNASNNPAVLGPISSDKVHEIFSAYKMNQFPFDADTTSDYADVSSFYSFVSDSHPEICALCCRMYAISLLSANVQRIVRGIGYVPTTTQTVKSPETVELLLHVGFASSTKKVGRNQSEPNSSTSNNSNSNGSNSSVIAGLSMVMGGCHPDEVFWNEDVWDEFSSDWRQFLELELAMDEFDAITEHAHAANSSTADSSNSSGNSNRVSEMISRKVPLDEVFVGTLAPLSTSGASSSTTTTVGNPADHDDAVLSMEM